VHSAYEYAAEAALAVKARIHISYLFFLQYFILLIASQVWQYFALNSIARLKLSIF